MNFASSLMVLAQANAGNPQGGGLSGMLFMMVPLFAIMYFLMIRPQQKKQKQHEMMLQGVKAGDKVMTSCGIFGKVIKVAERRVVIEIAERTQVEFLIDAIAQVIDETPKAEEEKK